MCARYTLRTDAGQIATLFDVGDLTLADDQSVPTTILRYNVAPTQSMPILAMKRAVTDDDSRDRSDDDEESFARVPTLAMMRWGLVPSWSNSLAIGQRAINCRAESAAEKPMFRSALKKRRCLVPASGFFEWKADGNTKRPYLITDKRGPLFGFAGLWEACTFEGQRIESFTILTKAANQQMNWLHDRMPIVLERELFAAWLDPERKTSDAATAILEQSRDPSFEFTAVSSIVNSVRHETPECIEPDNSTLFDM